MGNRHCRQYKFMRILLGQVKQSAIAVNAPLLLILLSLILREGIQTIFRKGKAAGWASLHSVVRLEPRGLRTVVILSQVCLHLILGGKVMDVALKVYLRGLVLQWI